MNKFILALMILLNISNVQANESLKITSSSDLSDDAPEIYRVIRNKDYNKLSALLKNGEAPCQQMRYTYKHSTNNITTAFEYAIRTGDTKIVKEFLPYINNITKPTCIHSPTLFSAIFIDDTSMIQFLIENGADINYASKFAPQNTPIEEALMQEKIKSAQFLIDHGAKIPLESQFKMLNHAVVTLKLKVIEFLIAKKLDLNYQDKDGNSILHLIALGEIDKNLNDLQKYLDSKFVQNTPDYRTSIIKTIDQLKSKWENYPKIIQLLVENGANVKLQN